jgi:hypothetical protein
MKERALKKIMNDRSPQPRPRTRNSVQGQEKHAMNRELFNSKWQQIRSRTTAWWGLMSDYDLNKVDKAAVKLDKYVTMLRVKYGYTAEQARNEIGRHVAEYESER